MTNQRKNREMTRNLTITMPVPVPTTKAKGSNKRRLRAKYYTIVLATVSTMVKAMPRQGDTSGM
jgi:hypothetical protein